jgi:hypothetical protein
LKNKAKRILTGILSVFFAACTVNNVISGELKGVGLFLAFTLAFGAYALFGDTAFKKPQ